MRIALAQLNPLVGDLVANGELLLRACRAAAADAAELVLAPELLLWGYPPRDLLLRSALLTRQSEVLGQLVAGMPAGLTLLVGAVEPADDRGGPPLHNVAVAVDRAGWRAVARKRLLPSYDVFDERRYFRPGHGPGLLDLSLGAQRCRLGITICEDLWVDPGLIPDSPYSCDPIEELLPHRPDLLVNLSASPYTQGKLALRRQLATAAALRLHCPVLYVNQVGGNDELVFDGRSFVVDRSGSCPLTLPVAASCTAWVDLQDGQVCGRSLPVSAPPQGDDDESLWQVLVLGLRDYAAKCGFRSALLGLSGGIDSALVACVATAAFGSQRVRCLLMPSPYSSAGSLTDARDQAGRLGLRHDRVPIASLMQGFDHSLEPLLGHSPDGVTAENLQSRIRGTLLMALANQEGHLLLSTGNKSELAVGYCTLYGDMNGGLAVIGDLYKTSVLRLCRWLNGPGSTRSRQAAGLPASGPLIPPAILTKPPSAELRPNQKDSDSLPDYHSLDPVLKALIEHHRTPEQLIADGHPPELVRRIWRLLRRSEFKRRQAPPVLKLSGRAFGSGWRMPIASA